MRYIKRIFQEPEKSYFLLGPRGTGKSTMVLHRHPEALAIDLRMPDILYRFLANPSDLLDLVRAQPVGAVIIIDEFKKHPIFYPSSIN